jgi:hypothetical protein
MTTRVRCAPDLMCTPGNRTAKYERLIRYCIIAHRPYKGLRFDCSRQCYLRGCTVFAVCFGHHGGSGCLFRACEDARSRLNAVDREAQLPWCRAELLLHLLSSIYLVLRMHVPGNPGYIKLQGVLCCYLTTHESCCFDITCENHLIHPPALRLRQCILLLMIDLKPVSAKGARTRLREGGGRGERSEREEHCTEHLKQSDRCVTQSM